MILLYVLYIEISKNSYNALSIHYTLLSKFEAGTLILVRIII